MAIQESREMYLETILILSEKNPLVRSVDVGEYMGFSRPSVSRAIGLLKESGLITVNSAGAITLTEEGRAQAEEIYDRHTTLTRILLRLGVDEETASEDACRVEHYISDKTFAAIKEHLRAHTNDAEDK